MKIGLVDILAAKHPDLGFTAGKIMAMSAIDLGGSAPSEFELMVPGKWDGYIHPINGKMSFDVTPERISAAVKYNQQRKQRAPQRDLVIDYEHATLFKDTAPASGWMKDLIEREGKLFASGVTWTPKAKKHIEDGEYRYISPVFAFDVLDKKTGAIVPMAVFNAGLTNEPFFDELTPLTSKDNSLSLYIFSKDQRMDELLQWLRNFLTLPLTATAEEIIAELQKLIGQIKVDTGAEAVPASGLMKFLKDQKEKVDLLAANYGKVIGHIGLAADAKPEAAIAVIARGIDTSLYVAKADYVALQNQLVERDVNDFVDILLAKGKITPATAPHWKEAATTNMAWAKKYFETVPEFSAVPLQEIVAGKQTPPDSAAGSFTPKDLEVAEKLGVSVENLKKHNS